MQVLEAGNVVNATTNSTTTGVGSTVSAGTGTTGTYKAASGTSYTLTEAGANGANLAQYSSTLRCTDSSGLQTGLPSNAAFSPSTGYAITPVDGAQISCVITNTPKLPNITLDQSVAGGIVLPATYNYGGSNGWTAKDATSTVAGVKGVATQVQNLAAAGVDTVLTPTLPPGQKIDNAWCTDANYLINGNSGGLLGTFTASAFTIAAANIKVGSVLVCHVEIGLTTPTILLSKKLVTNRINNNDQFTVRIMSGATVLANGTTTGINNQISGGSTGLFVVSPGTAYTVDEVMASGSRSSLSQYGASVACSNARTAAMGGTVVTGVVKLGDGFVPQAGDVITCYITNSIGPVTLMLSQMAISPFPVNLQPPFTFNYTINNGWPVLPQPLTSTRFNVPASTVARTLSASNTDTTLSTSLPDARWFASSFACSDTNAASTGNPPGNLVRVTGTSITIPASNVRPGSALKCLLILGHKIP